MSGRRIRLTAALLALLFLAFASFFFVEFSIPSLIEGLGDMRNLLRRMLPPRLQDPAGSVSAILQTFFMAYAGTVAAAFLSIPLAFLAARNTAINVWLASASRAIIVFCRAVPDLVFAVIFVRALGIGILPGVLAIALHSIGMLGKLLTDAVEEIDEGPREAITATGASRLQVLSSAVVPQVLPLFTGYFLYRLDQNVRNSTILGFVGAGGIGLELRAAFGTLHYQEALGIVILIILLIAMVEAVSNKIRAGLLSTEDFEPFRKTRRQSVGRFPSLRLSAHSPIRNPSPDTDSVDTARRSLVRQSIDQRRALRPPWNRERRTMFGFFTLLVAMLGLSLFAIEVSPIEPIAAVPEILRTSLLMFPPDFLTDSDRIISSTLLTIAIGFVATLLGTVLSIPVAVLAARNVSPNRSVYLLTRLIMLLVRGTPELILAVIFIAALGLGPLPGVMALTIGSLGLTAKLMAEAIEAVPRGPREAVESTGASRTQALTAAVLPQVVPSFISIVLYTLDVYIRASVVLGMVGAGGVGALLLGSLSALQFQRAAAIVLVVFVVVYVVERVSNWIRAQLI